MQISAFTYVRNGFLMDYPFLQSIQSLLPLVHEYVVVVGDSTDATREAIVNLSPKIRIIDSVWDLNLRQGGKVFAQQSNLCLDNLTGDWLVHLQADEVLHERDIDKLGHYITMADQHREIEGLLFPFLNFRGDYNHIHTGRTAHRYEIRAFRRNPNIRAYRDSQGFRKYSSLTAYHQGERGTKLKVWKIDVPVYHYSYVRTPSTMVAKAKAFQHFYLDDAAMDRMFSGMTEFDYNAVDRLEPFTGSHPAIMSETIANQPWHFEYHPEQRKVSFRHLVLNKFEEITGYRIGEYKNYRLVGNAPHH